MEHPNSDYGHRSRPEGMRHLAGRDRAGARKKVVGFVVALVSVGATAADRDHMDVGYATFAAGDDPLNIAKVDPDDWSLVAMGNECFLCEPSHGVLRSYGPPETWDIKIHRQRSCG